MSNLDEKHEKYFSESIDFQKNKVFAYFLNENGPVAHIIE